METRTSDLIRYALLGTALFIAAVFALKAYKRLEAKREVVAELQLATTEASYYRQFDQDNAAEVLLRAVALVETGRQLGIAPGELFDQVFERDQKPGAYDDYPIHERIVRDHLTRAHDAARQLHLLDDHRRLRELSEGRMPRLPGGSPVIRPLIDRSITPALVSVVPNLELHPARTPEGRELDTVELAAARRLARNLETAEVIGEATVAIILRRLEGGPAQGDENAPGAAR